jgi:hypothetical protein
MKSRWPGTGTRDGSIGVLKKRPGQNLRKKRPHHELPERVVSRAGVFSLRLFAVWITREISHRGNHEEYVRFLLNYFL